MRKAIAVLGVVLLFAGPGLARFNDSHGGFYRTDTPNEVRFQATSLLSAKSNDSHGGFTTTAELLMLAVRLGLLPLPML